MEKMLQGSFCFHRQELAAASFFCEINGKSDGKYVHEENLPYDLSRQGRKSKMGVLKTAKKCVGY